jgi:preprotein translocase subunit SecB
MEKAEFSFKGYRFSKVSFDFDIVNNERFDLEIHPSGKYNSSEGVFVLRFLFEAFASTEKKLALSVECESVFKFAEPIDFADIPPYFFANSIAIVFPYIRAFISTISVQAGGIKPIVIPTFNLTSLQNKL